MKKLLKFIFFTAIGAAAAWITAIKPRLKGKPDMTAFPNYDYARGGLADFTRGRPENSIPAYQSALDNGYGIEIGVRITKDGIAAAIADHDLWRLCGAGGTVEESSWADIKEMKLQETDEHPVSLKEALDFIDAAVPVIITVCPWRENYGTLCTIVAEVLEHYDGFYVIQSESSQVLGWFRKYMDEAVRGRILKEKKPHGGKICETAETLVNNLMLTNILTAPDYIAADQSERGNASLRLCRSIYHVPVVYREICTQEDYEAAREEDAIVIFEDIEP